MEIRDRVLNAIKWSASTKLLGQIITWGTTIYVIRLLRPEDYGLMALAFLFINFLLMLKELGLGAVLVQKEELEDQLVRKVFGFLLSANFLLFLVLLLLAPIIADFFDEPRLILLVRVLSLQFLIMAFEIVPMALLERELNLRKKSLAQLFGQIVGGVVSLSFALAGYGVWSLVYGALADSLVRTIGMNIAYPFLKLPIFSFKGMKESISFGGFVTGERVMWYLYNQADILIIGKLLGKDLLGIYSVAMHLSSLIMHKTGEVIYTVSFPAFSKVQRDKKKVGEYFLKAVRILGILVFPIFFGMSAIAQEIVTVLLGEKWIETIIVLEILCLVMPLRMISNLLPPMLQGIGKPNLSLYNLTIAIIVMPIAFIVGSHWGLIGVSLSWVIAFPFVLLIMLRKSLWMIELRVVDVVTVTIGPFIISAIMLFAIHYVKNHFLHELAPILNLFLLILFGAIIYSSLLLLTNRKGCREIFYLLTKMPQK